MLSAVAVWWARCARKPRCLGFGIQSPFAVGVQRDVIGTRLPYYAYEALHSERRQGGAAVPAHSEAVDRLLLRVANFVQPRAVLLPDAGGWKWSGKYMAAGCRRAGQRSYRTEEDLAQLLPNAADPVLLCFRDCVGALRWLPQWQDRLHPGSVAFIVGLRRNREARRAWQALSQAVEGGPLFDLYDVGLVFCDRQFSHQLYKTEVFL